MGENYEDLYGDVEEVDPLAEGEDQAVVGHESAHAGSAEKTLDKHLLPRLDRPAEVTPRQPSWDASKIGSDKSEDFIATPGAPRDLKVNKPNPAINLSGLPPEVAAALKSRSAEQRDAFESGMACGNLVEAIPHFTEADCETIYKGANNTYIVLGRDRPGSKKSGYGGRGDTQAGMIDICVGRMAPNPIQETTSGVRVYVNPLPTTRELGESVTLGQSYGGPKIAMDAARIYISQKTDVDYNFKLASGTVGSPGMDKNPKSAIALQADGIRIIGRENIKLVTHGPGSLAGIYNSQGGLLESVGGIDLIAGNNDEDLQPLVKGDNLIMCIEDIFEQIEDLNGIVTGFLTSQMKFNAAITSHTHHSPFFGMITSPSPQCIPEGANTLTRQLSQTLKSLIAQKQNIPSIESYYTSSWGGMYVCSSFNNAN